MFINNFKFLTDYNCVMEGTEIDLSHTGNYCALVGLNGSGKSSVIEYLYHSFSNLSNSYLPQDSNSKLFKPQSLINMPKYVFYSYSGESRGETKYRGNNIKIIDIDSKILYFACFVLQLSNDSIMEVFHLNNAKITHWQTTIKEQHVNNNYKILEYLINKIDYLWINVDEMQFSSVRDLIRHVMVLYIEKSIVCDNKPGKKNNPNLLSSFYGKALNLGEGEKKLILLKFIMFLADEDALILLDEPDANLDIQKKRILFEMIQSCKGQVVLTTHDPIMTKWMKGHLIFMKDGKQMPSNLVNALYEISEGEISYQETLLTLSKCKHFVFAEGKTDIAFIKKAIEKLNYSKHFENITFLSLGSSSAVEDKYYTTIAELLPKDTKKVLFLFDADKGGYEGQKQIAKIIKDFNDISKKQEDINAKKKKIKEITNEIGKKQLNDNVKKVEAQIAMIKKVDFDPNKLITYYFYNNTDDFDANDLNKWFYLEDYFSPKTYPELCQIRIPDIQNEYGYDSENTIIRYSH